MGKRKAHKAPAAAPDARGGVSSVTSSQQLEALLGSWTTREIQNKLQCSPEEAQHCATMVLSMDNKQLREWCTNLLGDLEKRLDDDRKFYNLFLDKKEDLGLIGNSAPTQISDTASECGSVSSTATNATSKSKRKFNKQVDISKVHSGHDALFPTSQECGCEATRHKLLTNCQLCGKIVCEQEGWGRCYFCGSALSRDAKPVRSKNDTDDDQYLARQREFLKAVAARDKLIQYQDERSKRTTIFDDQEDYYESSNPWLNPEERKKAMEKEKEAKAARLARHKKGGAYTVHIDFVNRNITEGLSHSASQAVDLEAPYEKREREEREGSGAKEEGEETNVHVTNNIYTPGTVTVLEEESSEEDEEGHRVKTTRVMRNPEAKAVVFDSSAMLGGWVRAKLVAYGFDEDEAQKQGNMVKRMTNMGAVRGWAKQNLDEDIIQEFIAEFQEETKRLDSVAPKKQSALPSEKPDIRQGLVKGSGRIQTDWEELDDAQKAPVEKLVKSIGKKKPWVYLNSDKAARLDRISGVTESTKCMSMHQPWASLLVCGIKKHEGRTWPTDFRGRLWIHAASHQPSREDIEDCEAFYADRGATTFPTHYPTSVLLGCVTVTDCLHFEEYEKKIPEADQESSSEHVFICQNPQLLVLPLPMDGKHKIFPLEKSVYEAVKRQAGRKGI